MMISMLVKLLLSVISGSLGLWLSAMFVSGVEFYGTYLSLIIMGVALGVINVLIKPFLKAVSVPIRILTLGLSSLIINMAAVWAIEILFPRELEIAGLIPLFWTTVIIWALNVLFGLKDKS